MEGFLDINKPEGITSAEVVRVIKRAAPVKKVGYIGTLDPIARGVLVVALKRATRLIPFLEKEDKIYDAVMRLGAATDTQDRTGTVIDEADPSAVTESMVLDVMRRYTGAIEQTPPMYSAKKIDGKRLYDLARQGKSVDREPVNTMVHEMKFIEKNGPDVRFTARVSTGTYLRTLCHDMGADLGVHGHLLSLTRTRSGAFMIENAVELETITRGGGEEIGRHLISLSDGLGHMAKVTVIPHAADRLKHGMALGVSEVLTFEDGLRTDLVRIVGKDGALLGVGQMDGAPLAGFPFASIKPKRVLA